ncbi:hypothetical protein Z947_3765 [Sulfitobacter geojensis]|nr:hypothetical protein Z947_3765 [Sulfitobacter geojensis]
MRARAASRGDFAGIGVLFNLVVHMQHFTTPAFGLSDSA